MYDFGVTSVSRHFLSNVHCLSSAHTLPKSEVFKISVIGNNFKPSSFNISTILSTSFCKKIRVRRCFFRPYKRQGKSNSSRLCILNIMKSRGSNYKSAAGDMSTQACHFVCKRIESSVHTGTTLTVILNSLQRVRLSSQTDKYPTSFLGCLILSLPWSEREREDWRERKPG